MTKVINFFAGPGSGKSTTATAVFAMCKMHDINCEYVPEYAKDEAWQGTIATYYNPIFYLGEQHNRQFRLKDKVDFMFCDSPLLQQAAYVEDRFYYETCEKLFNDFDNVNYFVERKKIFNPQGRKHNLKESEQIDRKIKETLFRNDVPYTTISGNFTGVNIVVNDILFMAGKLRRIKELVSI